MTCLKFPFALAVLFYAKRNVIGLNKGVWRDIRDSLSCQSVPQKPGINHRSVGAVMSKFRMLRLSVPKLTVFKFYVAFQ